jgi:hypothetical protein
MPYCGIGQGKGKFKGMVQVNKNEFTNVEQAENFRPPAEPHYLVEFTKRLNTRENI